jgi:hypothetical protein
MSMFTNSPLKLVIPTPTQTPTKLSKATKASKKAAPIVKTAHTEIILVEKTGVLKSLQVKDFKEEDLFKKCGYKKADGFEKRTEWDIKMEGHKYIVAVYAKTDGKANCENKYDFPPPIDTTLFFSTCAIVCKVKCDNAYDYTSLTLDMWEKMYEKLFGGFEDLAATCLEDENEIDELDAIPAEKKTKSGYLKDGFVVDSEDTEDETYMSSDEDDEDDDGEDSGSTNSKDEDSGLEMEDIGSELSEDGYEYSDDEEAAPTK